MPPGVGVIQSQVEYSSAGVPILPYDLEFQSGSVTLSTSTGGSESSYSSNVRPLAKSRKPE